MRRCSPRRTAGKLVKTGDPERLDLAGRNDFLDFNAPAVDIPLHDLRCACAPGSRIRQGDCHDSTDSSLARLAGCDPLGTRRPRRHGLLRLSPRRSDRPLRPERHGGTLAHRPRRSRRLVRRLQFVRRLVRSSKGTNRGLQMGLRRSVLGRVVERSARLLRSVRRLRQLGRTASLLQAEHPAEVRRRALGLPRRTVLGRRML